MNKLFNKNKKGRFLIYFSAIIIIGAIIYLLIVVNNMDNSGEEVYGVMQKYTIFTLNQKDSILLYQNLAAEQAKRDVDHSILAKNAGFYEIVDSSNPNPDISGCGNHIYVSLSDTTGKNCYQNFNYEDQYKQLFRENFLKYSIRIKDLRSNEFNNLMIKDNFIYPKSLKDVILLITDKPISIDMLPPNSIVNTDITSSYANAVADAIKNVDINSPYFQGVTTGQCSRFVYRLLMSAYNTQGNTAVECFPNDAWGVANCYYEHHLANPLNSRIVYAGDNIDMDQINSMPNLLKKGDILFSAAKTTWCKWSGVNYYLNQENVCGYASSSSIPEVFLRTDDAGNILEGGFCEPDSVDNTVYPLHCDFNQNGIQVDNGFIITHIFIYLGEDNDVPIVGNLLTNRRIDQPLADVVNNPTYDGIRMIVRPDYLHP